MAKLSRDKGAAFERWVANELKRFFPEARRGIQYRDGGKEVSDVVGTPFHIECKHGRKPSPRAALEQAKNDAKSGQVVCVIKDDRRKPFVVMPWDDFVWLLEYIVGEKDG